MPDFAPVPPTVDVTSGEQAANARHLERLGAAVALTGDITPDHLGSALGPLLADAAHRAQMAHRAREHGRPDAGTRLAELLLNTAASAQR
ncbi:hypothetical protein [Actinomadura flavalba]|uniref:hypothetical protein n=1 Tax=Actinomadura flavalba TaxID=1120938 RepID=UPI000367852E|nr:hypothetical protein [Actinomadura flavalba]